jgi:FADH2 O2-dependent halogenase
MSARYDIAVIGSGFAGSLIAMIARRLGYSVVLLEKGSHPRVVIGESSTPLSNLLFEELAKRYDLPLLKPLTKWGSWQRTYPQIACGLKRGFSFIHHELDKQFLGNDFEECQLLVAASPHDGIADTHWFRADFDHFLVKRARDLGVEYIDKLELTSCKRAADCWQLAGKRDMQDIEIGAAFLIDATGPRGFLHRTLQLKEERLPDFPLTSALYSHFSGVRRLQDLSSCPTAGSPYPIDDAALHHVFDGGWIWVLHFNNGWTSAGVAATEPISNRFNLADGEGGWRRLLDSLPLVRKQFSDAQINKPFTYLPKLSFLSSAITGEDWAMLPTAAGFVDPLLSTGIPLTLLGIARLAVLLEENLTSSKLPAALAAYAHQTRSELLATSRLTGSLYRNMDDFSMFRSLSLLYFAAASYGEAARRLNKPQLANGFLLETNADFGPECRKLLARARAGLNAKEKRDLEEDILRLVESFDVAGLCKRPSDHCYPVLASDLFASAHKLGATSEEIQGLLDRNGFLLSRIM